MPSEAASNGGGTSRAISRECLSAPVRVDRGLAPSAEAGRLRYHERRRASGHVPDNGEIGDLITEEPEFGLDPAPAPGGVFAGHRANQPADFEVDRRATG